ncbi:uncharacterized protein LOC135094329 isoform X1 [Scylla paramamosain]|uniref:uncharacterized protein LOC135094329 isoform X1 n=1 Tax=Scylla paramamosain TaxID=85552 RepID=UPI003083A478
MQEGLAVMTAGCHRPAGVMVPDQLVHISEMVVVLENSWFAKGSARQAACPHSHQKDHRFHSQVKPHQTQHRVQLLLRYQWSEVKLQEVFPAQIFTYISVASTSPVRSWEHRVLFGRKEARLLGHGLTPLSRTPTGMRGASQQATSPTQLPPAS